MDCGHHCWRSAPSILGTWATAIQERCACACVSKPRVRQQAPALAGHSAPARLEPPLWSQCGYVLTQVDATPAQDQLTINQGQATTTQAGVPLVERLGAFE